MYSLINPIKHKKHSIAFPISSYVHSSAFTINPTLVDYFVTLPESGTETLR